MIHLAIVLGDTGLYGLMKDKNNLETKCPLRNLSVSEREIYSFNAASGQIEAQPEDENAQMISTACFENPLFERVFLITSKRPSSVCVSAGVVLGCEGDSGGCLDEATRLAELLTTVTEVGTNSG